jgi:NAD(P)-dependent dehydrogenase (short-subunit alcohol dehydrogenase family)
VSDDLKVDLSGRRVLVTGAAGGIGSAIVRALEAAGASAFATDMSGADEIHRCDVSNEEDVASVFGEAVSGGAVTDVVHAAGICMTSAVADMQLSDWQRILDVNLTGSFLVGREAARTLPDGGNLIFIASVAGLTGDPFFGAYCASKFGIVALTQVMARELGHRRIRVNAVCPGGVRTAMSAETIRGDAERFGRSEEQLRSLYESDPFLNRWAEPEEVADACLFLLSSGSSYISGQPLVLNGGGNLSSHR